MNGGGVQFVLRRATGTIDEFGRKAPAIGILSEADVLGPTKTAELRLGANDVIRFSAGLIDLQGKDRRFLRRDGLANMVRRAAEAQSSAELLADAIRQVCEEFVDGYWRDHQAAIVVAPA